MLLETVPILGSDADGNLDPRDIPDDFRNSWEHEHVGIQTQEVIDTDRDQLLFVPFFSVRGQLIASLGIAGDFNFVIFAKSAEMLVVLIPLSLLFMWNRIAHLRDRNAGLPIIVYAHGAPPDSPVCVSVNDVTALVVRENDQRDSDGPMVQLYLRLSESRHILVAQDQIHRKRRFIKRVVSMQQWLQCQKRKGHVKHARGESFGITFK